jgi:hypothetical protein
MTLTEEDRLVESLKLEFEWHKHLTTLISGIVVALVTILQVFFTVGKGDRPYNSGEGVLLALCFISLGFGLVFSVLAMNWTLRRVRKTKESDWEKRWPRLSRLNTRGLAFLSVQYPIMALLGGLIFFVLFAYSRTL